MSLITNTDWDTETGVKISSSATSPGSAKVQSVILDGSKTEGNIGDNVIGYDTSRIDTSTVATKRQSLVFTETDGETTKSYEIENPEDLGTSTQVIVWLYDNKFTADGSMSFKLFIGSGDGTDYSVDGTGSNPWGENGINSEVVWHLNDTSGPITDSSPNNYGGTVSGASLNQAGQYDGGISTDGSNDYVTSGQNGILNTDSDFAAVAWLKNPQNAGLIVAKFDGSYDGVGIRYNRNNNNEVRFGVNSNSGNAQATPSKTVNDSNWHRLGMSWDESNTTNKAYTDLTTATGSTSIGDSQDGDGYLNVGAGGDGGVPTEPQGNFIQANIDEVRLYSEHKSSSWHNADYEASPKGGPSFFEVQTFSTTSSAKKTEYDKKKSLTVTNTSGSPSTDIAQSIEIVEEGKDGFEDGNFSSNPTWSDNGLPPSVTQNQAKNGSYSLNVGGTGLGVSYISHDRGSNDKIRDGNKYTAWFRSEKLGQGSVYSLSNTQHDPSGNDAITIRENNNLEIRTFDGGGSNINTTQITTISTSTWYKLQMAVDPANSQVTAKVFDDAGNELGSVTQATSGASNIQYAVAGTEDDDNGNAYLDDVSYSQYPNEDINDTGSIVIDPSGVSSVTDIGLFDQNDNVLNFEVENPGAIGDGSLSEPLNIWGYNSWIRDDSVQAQFTYANGPTENLENTEAAWNNTGQNVEAAWHLNEKSGQTIDSTSNNHDSTSTTGTTYNVPGQFDGARRGDGTNGAIDFGTEIIKSAPLTITAWFKGTSTGMQQMGRTGGEDDDVLKTRVNGSSSEYGIEVRDPNNTVQLDTGQQPDGDWHFLAFTYNSSGEVFVYMDGSQVNSDTSTLDGTLRSSTVPYRLFYDTFGNNYDGDIDEYKVYSRELTSDEISAAYDASPKGGQTFFSQSAAQKPKVTLNTQTINADADLTQQASLSGTTTMSTTALSPSYSLTGDNLLGTTDIDTESVQYSYSLSSSKLTPVFSTDTVEGSYAVNQSAFDVLGHGNEITVLINGQRIDTYTNIDAKTRLNEVDTFSFDAYITDSNDRSLINEGNIVKIIENYNELLFKGKLTEVEYKSDFRAKCEGDGMSTKLLNRKTDRTTYTNTAGDQIVKNEVSSNTINYGDIETAPNVSVRFDHDNKARAVAGVANATGFDWYVDQKQSDDYDKDYLNFVQDAGAQRSQATLAIGEDLYNLERDKDEGFVANDITLLGRGDGINQLEAQVFAATEGYSDTREEIGENFTGTVQLDSNADTLGASGDNLLVRTGIEVMDVDLQGEDSQSLDLINDAGGAGGGQAPTEILLEIQDTQIFFDEIGFETLFTGNVTVEVIDSSNNVIASKTVSASGSSYTSATFTQGDYSRLMQNEEVTIKYDAAIQVSAGTINKNYFITPSTNTSIPSKKDSNGGVMYSATAPNVPDSMSINSRGLDDYNNESTPQIKHYKGVRVWPIKNKTQGKGRFTPENRNTAEDGSSIESKGVKEQRETDRTIVDLSTLEKLADLELQNRFEDVFRVKGDLAQPDQYNDLQLGDTVTAKDLTAMDVNDEFQIVGKDIKRTSADEGTSLHLANRPRRLTERLSDIERDKDTLNAHMQGATNFNGESFEDNCDNNHPLANKILVPSDVVKINKFEVSFTRESFRGYILADSTTPDAETGEYINENILILNENTDETDPFVSVETVGSPTGGNEGVIVTATINNAFNLDKTYTFDIVNDTTNTTLDSETGVTVPAGEIKTFNYKYDSSQVSAGDFVKFDITNGDLETNSAPSFSSYMSLTVSSKSSHSHDIIQDDGTYGIFEPSTEPDIDVDLVVDGNTVTTFNNVSVGDEISPTGVVSQLSEPLAGEYHEIKLVPKDTGGGNDGRCRLSADITQKVFIESTL